MLIISVLASSLAPSLALAQVCGAGGRCKVEQGYYLAPLPAQWDGKSALPLVVAFDEIGVYNSMPITDGMFALRRLNGCPSRPDDASNHPRYACQQWSSCVSEQVLQLCLHQGGHSIPAEWAAEGYDRMLSLGPRSK